MHYMGNTPNLSRAGFLARAGTALALGAAGAGTLAARATAASGPLADLDLALARLVVGIELLAADFAAVAIESKHFQGDELRYLQRVAFNEGEHLVAVSEILSGAGLTPSTADDFDFAYPKGAFDSRTSIAQLGVSLETTSLGAYLGAVDAFAASDLKTTAARIAASEAVHLSLFSRIAYGRPVGISFPAPLDYATASAALDPFLGS
jgi:Ferritin-like domain